MNICNEQDFHGMKAAGELAGRALKYVCDNTDAGMTTLDIDNMFVKFLEGTGGKAACLNYHGFPKNLCVSVNDEVCHGIPGERVLQEGDVVSIDLVVELNGYHGDTCRTISIGQSSDEHAKLIQVSRDCLDEVIKTLKPNMLLSDIGLFVEKYVIKHGLSVCKDYCGHGIGRKMHEEPLVLHYYYPSKVRIVPGMCFTIEPILTTGKGKSYVLSDNWTVRTNDGKWCSQFEHTIGMTDQGAVVFTRVE